MALTARELITEIFSRRGYGAALDERRITSRQFDALRGMILAEVGDNAPGAGSVSHGDNRSIVWMPSGLDKYTLTEDVLGEYHKLTRACNIGTNGAGLLF